MSRILIVVALLAAGCHGQNADACERAMQRLDRYDARRHPGLTPAPATRLSMLDLCRRGGTAAYDPVLRCALDNESDEATDACIDAFLKAVVPAGSASPGSAKQGLNPLLEQQ